MGIYDRPYYPESQTTFSWKPARTWSAVNAILAINIVVFLADAIYNPANGAPGILQALALYDGDLFQPTRWFSFLTHGFTHASLRGPGRGIMHILMNMFVLWMFGRHVEAELGRTRFLVMYLTSIILCGLLTVLWHLAWNEQTPGMVGASGAVSTILIYFVFLAPQARVIFFIFPMPAWVMGLMIVAWDFIGGFNPNDNIAHEAHLFGAGLGAAFFYLGVPGFSGITSLQRWWRQRKFRVVQANEEKDQSLAADADRILEKVNQSGYDSLTPREKKTLEKYSRTLRQRQ